MAPATRSQSRKTRSAGAEVSGALPQALPEKQKKKSTAPKKTSKKRESPKQNEITADIETPTADGSPEHTQKKQKLMDEDAVDISPSSGSDSSPIADSGKELSSSEDATPESSEEVNGETPEIKKEAGSGYDSTPIQQPSQLDVKQEEVKPVKQEDIKQENTPQPALYSLKDEPRPSLKPEDLVDKSTLLSGEAAPILERGLFYFFARNKIDVEEASSVNDLQRSYLVLRPYPPSLMPTDEDVKNINNCRVLMFPKKKLPGTRSHEREIALVDLTNASIDEVRESVLSGYSYDTKTKGERTVQAAQPIASGVYALTQGEKDRSSHWAYIRTFPEGQNEVAGDLGLEGRGSFLVSARNPKFPPPQVIKGLPGVDAYPESVQEEFGELRWVGAHPDHFDVKNAQILWIGEKNQLPGATEEDRQTVTNELDAMEVVETMERIPDMKEQETNPIFEDLELLLQDDRTMKSLKSSWS